jgi:hypothetical protein
MPQGDCVWGVAVFKNQLYVGRAHDIGVHDVDSLTLQRRLSLPAVGCINDMATRTGSDVMYVVDNCHREIYVIDERGVRDQWTVNDTPLAISILALSSNALVTFENSRTLREYTPSGSLVRELLLPASIGAPTHAVKMPDNRYIVAHGNDNVLLPRLHRVCAVDERGQLLRCFGAEAGSGE